MNRYLALSISLLFLAALPLCAAPAGPAVTPEPSTLALVGGVAGIVFAARSLGRKKK